MHTVRSLPWKMAFWRAPAWLDRGPGDDISFRSGTLQRAVAELCDGDRCGARDDSTEHDMLIAEIIENQQEPRNADFDRVPKCRVESISRFEI